MAKDAEKPFIVHCTDYKVRVLGTTFNISAYTSDDVSMTTLVEGRVNVERGDTRVLLIPGVMASVTRSGTTKFLSPAPESPEGNVHGLLLLLPERIP